ncbi:MAG: DUF3575 domain-containing protein [Flavobacteriaceae bacterium]|nr:DUF3575 domain-containing protein [Flavobacteriaceae bacterium]
MTKKITVLLFCLFSISIFSQKSKLPTHELRLNLLYTAVGLPEISYEKIINNESSYGLSFAFSLDSYIDLNYIILPYYRHYFSKKRAAGFFMEANASLGSYKGSYYYRSDDGGYYGFAIGNRTGAGLGFSIGQKFVTKQNWTANITLGVSRNIVNNIFIDGSYPRIEIALGKRF